MAGHSLRNAAKRLKAIPHRGDVRFAMAGHDGSPVDPWAPPRRMIEAIDQGNTTHVDLLYVHVPFAEQLDEPEHGELLVEVHASLREGTSGFVNVIGAGDIIAPWAGDDIVAWIVHEPHPSNLSQADICSLPLALASHLRKMLDELGGMVSERAAELVVTHERLESPREARRERSYARALTRAQQHAMDPDMRRHLQEENALSRALERRAFMFNYQPIVAVGERRILAYEALCRGTMPDFRFPDVIFGAAERCDRVWDLGRVLRDIAADSLARLVEERGEDVMLFINVHPSDVDDPVFLEQTLSGPLNEYAKHVVFELTERAAIDDYRRVKELFATLRRHGYRVAIDDLGSGYAGLTALAELEPEFIKFDMGLVRDIHKHPVKQRLLQRMAEFAKEIGAVTISEGVEVPEERDALLASGCRAMQGYYFARPAPDFVDVEVERYGNGFAPGTTKVG